MKKNCCFLAAALLSLGMLLLLRTWYIQTSAISTEKSRLPFYSAIMLMVFFYFYRLLWNIFSNKKNTPGFVIAWLFGFLFMQPIYQDIIGIDTLGVYQFSLGFLQSESSTGRVFSGLLYDGQTSFALMQPCMLSPVLLFVLTFLTGVIIRLWTLMAELNETKNRITSLMLLTGILLAVYNPFSLEWITFTNALPGFYIHLSCILLAVDSLIRYPWRKGIGISLVLVVLACNGYQSMAALYILLAIPLLFIKLNRGSGVCGFKKLAESILIPGISSCIALGSSALWLLGHRFFFGSVQARVAGKTDVMQNILYLKSMLPDLLKKSYNLLPAYLFFGIVILLLILILAGYKNLRFPFWHTIAILMSALIGNICFSILFQLFIPEPLIVARSVFAFSSIPGMMMIFLILYRKPVSYSTWHGLPDWVAGLLCWLLLGLILIESFKLSLALKEVFRRDMIEAEQVIRRIEQLEKQQGCKLDKIYLLHDYPYQETYPGIKYAGFASRLMAVSWKLGPFLKLYFHRDFTVEKKYNLELFRRIYGNRQWDGPDFEQQIILKDGIIYIAAY